MDELLSTVKSWYLQQSKPNSRRAFYECPICHQTWWGRGSGLFDKEVHTLDCWVPSMNDLNIHPLAAE